MAPYSEEEEKIGEAKHQNITTNGEVVLHPSPPAGEAINSETSMLDTNFIENVSGQQRKFMNFAKCSGSGNNDLARSSTESMSITSSNSCRRKKSDLEDERPTDNKNVLNGQSPAGINLSNLSSINDNAKRVPSVQVADTKDVEYEKGESFLSIRGANMLNQDLLYKCNECTVTTATYTDILEHFSENHNIESVLEPLIVNNTHFYKIFVMKRLRVADKRITSPPISWSSTSSTQQPSSSSIKQSLSSQPAALSEEQIKLEAKSPVRYSRDEIMTPWAKNKLEPERKKPKMAAVPMRPPAAPQLQSPGPQRQSVPMTDKEIREAASFLVKDTGLEGKQLYQCKRCGEELETFLWFCNHLSHCRLKTDKFECIHCKYSSPKVNDLAEHTLETHHAHTHICGLCLATSKNDESMKEHFKLEHKDKGESKKLIETDSAININPTNKKVMFKSKTKYGSAEITLFHSMLFDRFHHKSTTNH